MFVINTEHHC